MSAIADLWRAVVARMREVRQAWCRHDWHSEGDLIKRPGRDWHTAEMLYRCRKCGATRQEGIF